MSLNVNTSKLTDADSIMQVFLEGNSETTTGMPTVVSSFLGTFSGKGTVIPDQVVEEINKEKPWREVIKRSIINGGSDN